MNSEEDPVTFEEAMKSPHSSKWHVAMEDELKSMKENKVWDLEEIPKEAKTVGCKWVYKTKCDSKGKIERYKARLVTKGFTQREGIDYNKTFSPVSTKDSFRIIMTLVAHFDLELHQMDVKTQDNLSKWRTVRKCIHGTTERFCHRRKRKVGVPLEEVYLWLETSL